jgi:hypothetical protein
MPEDGVSNARDDMKRARIEASWVISQKLEFVATRGTLDDEESSSRGIDGSGGKSHWQMNRLNEILLHMDQNRKPHDMYTLTRRQ